MYCTTVVQELKTVRVFMEKYIFSTGTVTYAIKAKDILKRKGINAYVERSSAKDRIGCGYGVVVASEKDVAEQILRQYGIKILDVKKK